MANKVNPFDSMSKARKDEQEQLVESTKNPTTEPKKPTPKKKTVSEETGRLSERKKKEKELIKNVNINISFCENVLL